MKEFFKINKNRLVLLILLFFVLSGCSINFYKRKDCSKYKMPMTSEQRDECVCASGKKKFQGYAGAYCASDSQKPCKKISDCPENESCSSSDGKKWVCTGNHSGCYYSDPENPGILCVD